MSKILLVEDNPDAVKRIIRYINKIFAELDVISFPALRLCMVMFVISRVKSIMGIR